MTTEISLPRGRPRTFDIDEAVETAQALFHARGYDHVGVAELSAAIGIRQPSLYAAFGSKLGLFEAVLDRYASRDGQFIGEAFAKASTAEEGLREMLASAARTYGRDGAAAGCLVMEGAHGNHDAGARAVCADKRAATQSYIAAFVDGGFPGSGEKIAALAMIALAGLSSSARAGMKPEALSEFATLAADGLIELLGETG